MKNILPKAQIPLRNFSDYFFENIAIGDKNQLQITSTCNAKCTFCSNEQNPFEIKRCSFRSTEEIEKVVWSMQLNQRPIFLNESLPGRISEGEAFLHPQFFEILKIIRKKFQNNSIEITTNASMLTPELIRKLKTFNPINLSISIHSINKNYWKESFKLKDDHYDIAINSFPFLNRNNIRYGINMVPMPSWFGWDDLEKTIKHFAPSNFMIYGAGYTKYTPEKELSKLKYDKMELSLFLEKMSHKYNFIYKWQLDPRKALYINYDLITNNILSSINNKSKNLLWLTSMAAKERFEKLIKTLSIGYPIKNTIIDVKNNTYGGNIEVSGLLTLKDVEETLNKYLINETPDTIFIPNNFLDGYGFDLLGDNVTDFLKKYENIKIHFI